MRHLISVREGPPSLDAQLLESSAHPSILLSRGQREGL